MSVSSLLFPTFQVLGSVLRFVRCAPRSYEDCDCCDRWDSCVNVGRSKEDLFHG